jgi:hypothetical protein
VSMHTTDTISLELGLNLQHTLSELELFFRGKLLDSDIIPS